MIMLYVYMYQHNLTDGDNSMQVALIGLLAGTMPGACAETQRHSGPVDLDFTADLAKGGSFCQGLRVDFINV